MDRKAVSIASGLVCARNAEGASSSSVMEEKFMQIQPNKQTSRAIKFKFSHWQADNHPTLFFLCTGNNPAI